jgi:hypothetical protein
VQRLLALAELVYHLAFLARQLFMPVVVVAQVSLDLDLLPEVQAEMAEEVMAASLEGHRRVV